MTRRLAWTSLFFVVASAAGCSEGPRWQTMSLGSVGKEDAFSAAQEVVGMYFVIENADPLTQTIKCRPKNLSEDYQERLLGGSPTRRVARIELFPEDGQMTARVSVQIQQQGSAVQRSVMGSNSYDPVPHQTPAQIDAATTTEQNETWRTVGYAADVESKILYDIYHRLHPERNEPAAQTAPATQP